MERKATRRSDRWGWGASVAAAALPDGSVLAGALLLLLLLLEGGAAAGALLLLDFAVVAVCGAIAAGAAGAAVVFRAAVAAVASAAPAPLPRPMPEPILPGSSFATLLVLLESVVPRGERGGVSFIATLCGAVDRVGSYRMFQTEIGSLILLVSRCCSFSFALFRVIDSHSNGLNRHKGGEGETGTNSMHSNLICIRLSSAAAVCSCCRPHGRTAQCSTSSPPLGKWTRQSVPDLRGRLVVVSGFNSGAGYETSRTLLEHGCEVIGISRNEELAWQAIEDLREEFPGAAISYKVCLCVWVYVLHAVLARIVSCEAFITQCMCRCLPPPPNPSTHTGVQHGGAARRGCPCRRAGGIWQAHQVRASA